MLVQGDAVQSLIKHSGKKQILVQQVNCQGVMGAGIAKQIRAQYPVVFEKYKKFCPKPDKNMLGKVLPVQVANGTHILNIFGQEFYGNKRGHIYTDYAALKAGLTKTLDYAVAKGIRVVKMPYGIGCGLAGGDWNIVSAMLKELANTNKYADLTVVLYKL